MFGKAPIGLASSVTLMLLERLMRVSLMQSRLLMRHFRLQEGILTKCFIHKRLRMK